MCNILFLYCILCVYSQNSRWQPGRGRRKTRTAKTEWRIFSRFKFSRHWQVTWLLCFLAVVYYSSVLSIFKDPTLISIVYKLCPLEYIQIYIQNYIFESFVNNTHVNVLLHINVGAVWNLPSNNKRLTITTPYCYFHILNIFVRHCIFFHLFFFFFLYIYLSFRQLFRDLAQDKLSCFSVQEQMVHK